MRQKTIQCRYGRSLRVRRDNGGLVGVLVTAWRDWVFPEAAVYIEPKEAREIGQALIQIADELEGKG